ncbi:LysR family transcriptional regulator, transcription activator of glutamate synthase operon [Mesobacillus persicus]|uniref:LysR family transcriptional regulator, transcription activator of glutamate synthase operon n=1 Tax=Mesobacillus persicus TaxID=930146 RepID=A0A1H8KXZ1_9BACI|nr:LysR family transcriptional regulator [Mesobacillus persicus]SEN97764.1 LysR family transcriptional regulator, transcription activator of glutamate synthase operon [Mesobacillus persicus]
MELRQLQYFVEVAKREHVTEAAVHLHVAQSAVSLQISKLEDELGVSLFERVGRNVKLTQIGRSFLVHVNKALKELDNAKQNVKEYLDPEQGTIKVGYPTSLASHLLPTVISAFREDNPKITFHLRQGSYASLIEAVKSGDLDLAFLGPVPTNEPGIQGTTLFTEKLSALVHISHPLAKSKRIALTDLRTDDFALFPKGYVLQQIVVDACKQAGFSPNIASEGEDMDALKGLVSAGIGTTLLPDSTISDSVPRFTVKIPVTDPQVTRTVGIIIPKTREIAPSDRTFYQFVINFFTVLEQYQ